MAHTPEPSFRDGSIVIDGRQPRAAQDLMVVAHEYRKTANVYAIEAGGEGIVHTPEGAMGFVAGDMLVSDIPPTHLWPVRRAVFDATYIRVPRPGLDPVPEEGRFWPVSEKALTQLAEAAGLTVRFSDEAGPVFDKAEVE